MPKMVLEKFNNPSQKLHVTYFITTHIIFLSLQLDQFANVKPRQLRLTKNEEQSTAPTIKSVIASLSSLCFSENIFWLSVSFIGLYEFFMKCGAPYNVTDSGGATEIFFGDPMLCLYLYLMQLSCLFCSIKFCCFILPFFQCLNLNYLEAYQFLCLQRNLLLIVQALRRSGTQQYQHQQNSLPLLVKCIFNVVDVLSKTC